MSCCGKPSIASVAARGAVGLAKVALGVDRAPESVVTARRDVCRSCEHSTKRLFGLQVKVQRCNVCQCLIAGKSVLLGEKCPEGRWKE